MTEFQPAQTRTSAALGALVFTTGAGLMCVEIVGGMTIAPHFGSNVFVWGSVITAFMAALSLGYTLGGRLADSGAGRGVLAALTLAAGLLVALVPFVSAPVCRALLGLELGSLDVVRPLIAVLILYFIPSLLLGMILPVAVAAASSALASVGRVVGWLYALNALGSVFGALAATFILIVLFGNRAILFATGLVLALAGIVSFWTVRRAAPPQPAVHGHEAPVLPTAGLRPLVFVCGAVLMGLEVIGGAEIAPYFGSSVFVWGSVIAVFLGAMTTGYRVGGWLADRRPRLMTLASLVIAAGITTLVIPLLAPGVCKLFLGIPARSASAILRPLFAAVLLYFIPVTLLATVAPFAVRLSTARVDAVGGVAGRLYALSTLGNVLGVLLTTFILISAIGKTHIFGLAGFAAVAAAVGAVFLHNRATGEKRQPVLVSALLLLAVAALAVSPKPALVPVADSDEQALGRVERDWTLIGVEAVPGYHLLRRIRAEYESPYHHIAILEQKTLPCGQTVKTDGGRSYTVERTTRYGTRRELRFDQYVESAVLLDDAAKEIRSPYTSGVIYSDLLHLPLLFQPDIRDVVIIGGGGGVVPTLFKKSYPQMTVDVVEIDPVVVRVAKRWFGLEPSDRLRLHVQDGRMFICNSKEQYDLIILDAYTAGGRIPFHLTTTEFLIAVRDHVRPRGVVLMNVISAVKGPASKLFRAEYKTFASVFGRDHVYVFPKITEEDEEEWKVTESRNVILIATGREHTRRLAHAEVVSLARNLVAEGRIKLQTIPRHAANMLTELQLREIPQDDVPVLTDDYAPVDMMAVSAED